MRTASVAQGEGARLAAAVSLVLASAKVRDHADDGDGALRRRPVAAAARKVAAGWDRAGARTGAELGFDTAVLTGAVDRQQSLEAAAVYGGSVMEPTETATAAAFAHTAVLAGRPGNQEPLAEAGRLFGRLAHLLDAVEDLTADEEAGAWNPLTATGTPLPEARRLCDDAVHGIRLALDETHFTDDGLARLLLGKELRRSVRRSFRASGAAGSACDAHDRPDGPDGGKSKHGWGRRREAVAGCAVWTGLCVTGQLCCRDPYHDPWSGKPKEGWCRDCDCCGGCECCEGWECDCKGCCSDCSCCGGDGGCGCGCDGCDCGCN